MMDPLPGCLKLFNYNPMCTPEPVLLAADVSLRTPWNHPSPVPGAVKSVTRTTYVCKWLCVVYGGVHP